MSKELSIIKYDSLASIVKATNTSLGQVQQFMVTADEQPKIRAMDEANYTQQCANFLTNIARNVGITTGLSERDMLSVIVFIRKWYSDLSLSEVKLAFELLLIGELDAYLPKKGGDADRNHYQQFVDAYVAKVLNAFREKKRPLVVKIRLLEPSPEPTAEQKKELLTEFQTSIIRTAEKIKQDTTPTDFETSPYVYRALRTAGVIIDKTVITDEDVRLAMVEMNEMQYSEKRIKQAFKSLTTAPNKDAVIVTKRVAWRKKIIEVLGEIDIAELTKLITTASE